MEFCTASLLPWINANRVIAIAAVFTTIATVGAAIAAWYIGKQAGHIATAQKELVGIQHLNEFVEKLDQQPFVRIRREVALNFITGVTDELPLRELLNLLDDLGAYPKNGYLPIQVIDDRLGFTAICWWYAGLPIVDAERIRADSRRVWDQAEYLVNELHAFNLRTGDLAWSKEPSRELMEYHFLSVLRDSS